MGTGWGGSRGLSEEGHRAGAMLPHLREDGADGDFLPHPPVRARREHILETEPLTPCLSLSTWCTVGLPPTPEAVCSGKGEESRGCPSALCST